MNATPRIATLFDTLLEQKGSDLHLSVGYPPLGRIRGDIFVNAHAPSGAVNGHHELG